MKKVNLILLLVSLSFIALAQTQKMGHLNSGNLLSMLPDIKEADAELNRIQDSLEIEEQTMVAAFEEEYTKFVQLANAGELTKIQIQTKQAEFQEKEQEILDMRKRAQMKVLEKRQEVMNPILDKLQTAVDDVAKENGFHYIFDVGSGSLLFANETVDIEPLVRKKLGIEEPADDDNQE